MRPTPITLHVAHRARALGILLAVAICTPAAADLYQYTDNRGTVCMTNDLGKVPPAKRKGVKVISEDPKPRSPAASKESTESIPSNQEQSTAALPTSTLPEPSHSSPPRLPWVKMAIGGLGALILLFLVSRLTRSLSSPQFAKVIYVAFFLGTFVFGYTLYANHLVNGYFAIKGKFISLFAKAQQREGLASPRPKPGEPEP
jgi:hypothetical protein